MGSVYQRVDKRTGNTYAYETTSYRDPETRKVRTHQTYLGRIDPVTGQLIPKGEGGRRRRAPSDRAVAAATEAALERIRELEAQVEALTRELERVSSQETSDAEFRRKATLLVDSYRAVGA